jgi:hypothetical protein
MPFVSHALCGLFLVFTVSFSTSAVANVIPLLAPYVSIEDGGDNRLDDEELAAETIVTVILPDGVVEGNTAYMDADEDGATDVSHVLTAEDVIAGLIQLEVPVQKIPQTGLILTVSVYVSNEEDGATATDSSRIDRSCPMLFGESEGDSFGQDVAMSRAGDRFAVGAPSNDGNGDFAGHVRVYGRIDGFWTQLGDDIDGEAGTSFGWTVTMNAAGTRIASGGFSVDGYSRVFEYNGSSWVQMGSDLGGGRSIALNETGDRVAVAGGNNVRVYDWNSSTSSWDQVGGDNMVGENFVTTNQSVDLNNLGDRVAISGIGGAWVYELVGGVWTRMGVMFTGGGQFGYDIGINAVGDRVAIGARHEGPNFSGAIHVYEWNSGDGVWNILGEPMRGSEGDEAGERLSINEAGDRILMGSPSDNYERADLHPGSGRLFEWDGVSWIQLGVFSDTSLDGAGKGVVLDGDGNIVGVGAYQSGPGMAIICPVLPPLDVASVVINDGGDGILDEDELATPVIVTVTLPLGAIEGNMVYVDVDGDGRPNMSRVLDTDDINTGSVDLMVPRRDLAPAGATMTVESWVDNGGPSERGSDSALIDRVCPVLFGEEEFDLFGYSMSLNRAGDRAAFGGFMNNGNGVKAGFVRVYELVDGQWRQLGSDIDGNEAGAEAGQSVSLNAAGDRVAVGAPFPFGLGYVQIYHLVGDDWVQMGADITGDNIDDRTGSDVALNATGDRIAIGSPHAPPNDTGYVRVYEWSGARWVRVGGDMVGDRGVHANPPKAGGLMVDINDSGDRVAFSAPVSVGPIEPALPAGRAFVFELVGNVWMQMGDPLEGDESSDKYGYGLALDAVGDRLAVSAREARESAGVVRIYDWNGSAWMEVGDPLIGNDIDQLGHSVALSDDGNRLLLGAPHGLSDQRGFARLLRWDGEGWTESAQIDDPMAGWLGNAVALDGAGETMISGGYLASPGYAKICPVVIEPAPSAPNIQIVDGNDDVLNAIEVSAGVNVNVTLPFDTVIGLILNVDTNNDGLADVTITLNAIHVAAGMVIIDVPAEDVPPSGSLLLIEAWLATATGTISASITDSVLIDTIPPSAPNISIADGGDNVLSLAEISAGVDITITLPSDATVGDTLFVDMDGDNTIDVSQVLDSDDITVGELILRLSLEEEQLGGLLTVGAYLIDEVGNTGAEGSDNVEVNITRPTAPTVLIADGGDNVLSVDEVAAGVIVEITIPNDTVINDVLSVDTNGDHIPDHVLTIVNRDLRAVLTFSISPEHIPASGLFNVDAWISNIVSNMSEEGSDTVIVDGEAPSSPTVSIEDGGDGYINTEEAGVGIMVTIGISNDASVGDVLHVDTDGDGVSEETVVLTADNTGGMVSIGVASVDVFGTDLLVIDAWIIDVAGNKGSVGSDSVIVDTVPPSTLIISIDDGGDGLLDAEEVTIGFGVNIGFGADHSEGDILSIDIDGDYVADMTRTISLGDIDTGSMRIIINTENAPASGILTVAIWSTDVAGNIGSPSRDSTTVHIDDENVLCTAVGFDDLPMTINSSTIITDYDGMGPISGEIPESTRCGEVPANAERGFAGVGVDATITFDSEVSDFFIYQFHSQDGDELVVMGATLSETVCPGFYRVLLDTPSTTVTIQDLDQRGGSGYSFLVAHCEVPTPLTAPHVSILDGGDERLNADEIDSEVSVTVVLSAEALAGDTLHIDTNNDGTTDHDIAIESADVGDVISITINSVNIPNEGLYTIAVWISDADNNLSSIATDTTWVDRNAPSTPSVTILDGGDELLDANEIATGVAVELIAPSDSAMGDILSIDTDGDGVADQVAMLEGGTVTLRLEVYMGHIPDQGDLLVTAWVTDLAGNMGEPVSDTSTIPYRSEPDICDGSDIISDNSEILTDDLDSDGDGLYDVEEVVLGTNPCDIDSDDDGLSDSSEIALRTDPTKADTDGDGVSDLEELNTGRNPNGDELYGDTRSSGGGSCSAASNSRPLPLLLILAFCWMLARCRRKPYRLWRWWTLVHKSIE